MLKNLKKPRIRPVVGEFIALNWFILLHLWNVFKFILLRGPVQCPFSALLGTTECYLVLVSQLTVLSHVTDMNNLLLFLLMHFSVEILAFEFGSKIMVFNFLDSTADHEYFMCILISWIWQFAKFYAHTHMQKSHIFKSLKWPIVAIRGRFMSQIFLTLQYVQHVWMHS